MTQEERLRTNAVAKSLARRQLESGAPLEEVIDGLVARGWTRPEASDFVLLSLESIPKLKKDWIERLMGKAPDKFLEGELGKFEKVVAWFILFAIGGAIGGFLGLFPIGIVILLVQGIIGEVPRVVHYPDPNASPGDWVSHVAIWSAAIGAGIGSIFGGVLGVVILATGDTSERVGEV